MGDTTNKRERGLWSIYTPASTPFKMEVGKVIYPLPSLKALSKFGEEVEQLRYFYGSGRELIDENGDNLSFEDAVGYVYKKRYHRWLENQEKN